MKFFVILISIFQFLHLSLLNTRAEDFTIKSYSLSDGVPFVAANDVVQDYSGLMWFTSQDGIFTFDSYNWVLKYSTKESGKSEYKKLFVDSNNVIWALPDKINQPVIYYQNMEWNQLPIILDNPDNEINLTAISVLNINESKIFVGTNTSGCYVFEDGDWRNIDLYSRSIPNKINAIEIVNDTIYLATDSGLFSYNQFRSSPFSKLSSKSILALCSDAAIDNKELLWMVGENWVGYLNKDNVQVFASKLVVRGHNFSERYSITATDEFLILGNTSQSFVINKRTGKQSYFDNKTTQNNIGVNSLYVDFENSLWLVNNNGIHKIRQSIIEPYSQMTMLAKSEITAIEFFKDGEMFLGHNNGFTIVDENDLKYFDLIDKLNLSFNHSRVLDAETGENNKLFITSQNYGLGVVEVKGKIQWYRLTGEEHQYYAVHIDANGNIWTSIDNELFQLSSGSLKKVDWLPLEHDYIRIISSSHEASLILGTSFNGVLIYKDGKVSKINAELSGANNIFSLYPKKNGEVFVGTMAGLYEIENEKLVKFSKNGLSIDQPVFFIEQDASNNFLFGLEDGVLLWNGKVSYMLNEDEGLLGSETNRAAGKADTKGNFWIGTSEGLSSLSSNKKLPNIKPISKLLFLTTNEGEKYKLDEEVKFHKEIDECILHFDGISFIDEKRNQNEITLVTLNSGKEEKYFTKNNEIKLANLPKGQITIKLRTKNGIGIWGDYVSSSVIFNTENKYSDLLVFTLSALLLVVLVLSVIKSRKYIFKRDIQQT